MNDILDFSLLKLGGHAIRVYSLVSFFAFITIVVLILRLLRKFIFARDKIHVSKKFALYSLLKYIIVVVAVTMGIQILGFNLSVLLAGSAALLVGVGLGLQNLFSDFVSGIIILVDSSIKVDDIIEVNGLVCKVQEIDLRTTTVLTRDGKYIILPNTDLTKNHLINWTHSEVVSRFEVTVGVDYSCDVPTMMNLLGQAVEGVPGVLPQHQPIVRFTDFADSALMFSVLFWSDDVFRVENIKSEIRVRIFEVFKENNITIPFPQRTIHIAGNDHSLPAKPPEVIQ